MVIKSSVQLGNEYFDFSFNGPIPEGVKITLEKKLLILLNQDKITSYNYSLFHAFVLNDHGKSIIDSHIPEIIMRRVHHVPIQEYSDGRDDVWIKIQDSLAETYRLLEKINVND